MRPVKYYAHFVIDKSPTGEMQPIDKSGEPVNPAVEFEVGRDGEVVDRRYKFLLYDFDVRPPQIPVDVTWEAPELREARSPNDPHGHGSASKALRLFMLPDGEVHYVSTVGSAPATGVLNPGDSVDLSSKVGLSAALVSTTRRARVIEEVVNDGNEVKRPAVRVRVRKDGDEASRWIPGQDVAPMRVGGDVFYVGYGSRAMPLPFRIHLVDFKEKQYPRGANQQAMSAEFSSRVLLDDNLEIRRNSEWLGALDMAGLLELTSAATVAQMLERSDFSKRYEEGSPISVMEFLYPLLQGYDSVAVEADVELGGSDQLWNLMMGRVVQERYGMEPQVAITMPLLVGTDGVRKMSQSLGNYIGVEDPPEEMFGKTMSIPDAAMVEWFRLAADVEPEEAARIEAGLASGEVHPRETKRRLARAVTALYWGEDAAVEAERAFDRVFKLGGIPEDIDTFTLPEEETIVLPSLIREVFGLSGAEARRLLTQGAVKLEGEAVDTQELGRSELEGRVLQVGKRRFVRLI